MTSNFKIIILQILKTSVLVTWNMVIFIVKIVTNATIKLCIHFIVMSKRLYYYMKLYGSAIKKYNEVTKKKKSRKAHNRQYYEPRITNILNNWYEQHQSHPYATREQKNDLAELTSLSHDQITRWLINARRLRHADAKEIQMTLS